MSDDREAVGLSFFLLHLQSGLLQSDKENLGIPLPPQHTPSFAPSTVTRGGITAPVVFARGPSVI